jgi:26S proteasome non-ATPase regulatory subunit 10
MNAGPTSGLATFTDVEVKDIKAWINELKTRCPTFKPSIIHEAHRASRNDVVRWFLLNGDEDEKDINAKDMFGKTRLHWAAELGYIDIVKYLFSLEQCPQANLMDNAGLTPLHYAAIIGHIAIGDFLLNLPMEQRADVNAQDNYGHTTLHLSALHHQAEFFKFLWELPPEKRPDVNLRTHTQSTPLHSAALAGSNVVVSFLLEKCNVNARDKWNYTPLGMAISRPATALLLLTLPKGQIDVNITNTDDGKAPIVDAYEKGYYDVVRALEQHGAQLPAHLRATMQSAGYFPSTGATAESPSSFMQIGPMIAQTKEENPSLFSGNKP